MAKIDKTEKPAKGSVSPLEGAIDPQATQVFGIAFRAMGLQQCAQLTASLGPALKQAQPALTASAPSVPSPKSAIT